MPLEYLESPLHALGEAFFLLAAIVFLFKAYWPIRVKPEA